MQNVFILERGIATTTVRAWNRIVVYLTTCINKFESKITDYQNWEPFVYNIQTEERRNNDEGKILKITSPSTTMSTILGGTMISSTNFAKFDSATCKKKNQLLKETKEKILMPLKNATTWY